MLRYSLRPLISVPERLDALQDLIMHLEFIEVCLKWIEGGNTGYRFFGARKSGAGEVVRWHVGALFVLYHEVMLQ